MKIAHLCLSCFYIDSYAYQENELVRQHVLDGHDVVVIASPETYGKNRRLTYLQPREYVGSEGARVIRLPYLRWLPHALAKKLRMHPSLNRLLEREKPEIIMFHGLCGWELITIKQYKRRHPSVKIYADSHEDFNNSARSFVSKWVLHGVYYRTILRKALDVIEKVLCISIDTISFVRDFYGVPAEKIEFYPLGGMVYEDEDYTRVRGLARTAYAIGGEDILLVQSGKMDKTKKALETLSAFVLQPDPRLRLILAGHLHEDIVDEVEAFMRKDRRICFVGWKTPEELRDLLCAADVYVQPGTQSATMQMSLCARCAVILDDVPSHKPFVNGNGWLLGKDVSLAELFSQVSERSEQLPLMSRKSSEVASNILDYRKLAARLYS